MSNWADLPVELLSLILVNLSGKDRHTFSLVCRSWYTAQLVSPGRHSPCLMFYESSNRLWKFLGHNIGFFSREIPQLDNAEILCSKHGWLLMSRNRYNLFFFNPSNNQSFDVPRVNKPYDIFCFFHPPNATNCIIVGFAARTVHYPGVHIGVLKGREDQWNHYKYDTIRHFISSVCNPILHRGLLYFLDVKGNVGTFNIEEKPKPSWTFHVNCLMSARLRRELRQHFLIKVDGEDVILAVFVAHDERKVYVFKFLEPDMEWVPVKDLGDKILFVSRTTSFVRIAPLKTMANKIYFPNLHGDSGVFYSLDSQQYHSFDRNYSSCEFYGLKEISFATWITL